jgi:hypothetical protein
MSVPLTIPLSIYFQFLCIALFLLLCPPYFLPYSLCLPLRPINLSLNIFCRCIACVLKDFVEKLVECSRSFDQ